MHVRSLALELRLAHCHSLKEKRSVVRTILDGAQRRYGVAAAEVDHQDKWQRARLGFAAVSGSWAHAGEVLAAVERFALSFPEVELIEVSRDDHD